MTSITVCKLNALFCYVQKKNYFYGSKSSYDAAHYVNDPILRGSAIPDFEALVVLFRMVEVYSEVINAHLHVIRAL